MMKNEAPKAPATCPRCGGLLGLHPATSRADNTTRICSLCGTAEALQAAGTLINDAAYTKVMLEVAREQQQRQEE